MADRTVEEYQRLQSARIAQSIISQSREQEQKMLNAAHKAWEGAHQQLISIITLLDTDLDESCAKSKRPLESFSDEDLGSLILYRLKGRAGKNAPKDAPGELGEVRRRLEEAQRRVADLERSSAELKERKEILQEELEALRKHQAVLEQVHRDPQNQPDKEQPASSADVLQDASLVPGWFSIWQASALFDKMSAVVCLMGSTGTALRPSITKRAAADLSVSEDNKGLNESMNLLMHPASDTWPILVNEVLGRENQRSSSGGSLPGVLQLSLDGQTAYSLLTGKLPEANQYQALIRLCASAEHTILNIQAAELLQAEGYRLKGCCQKVQLSSGETYIPDIVVVDPRNGETLFVEVEHSAGKDREYRKQKWMKAFEASHGNLYVFCDNLSGQRSIQGEINMALGGLEYGSSLTNLFSLREGKRSLTDRSIWLSRKRGR